MMGIYYIKNLTIIDFVTVEIINELIKESI